MDVPDSAALHPDYRSIFGWVLVGNCRRDREVFLPSIASSHLEFSSEFGFVGDDVSVESYQLFSLEGKLIGSATAGQDDALSDIRMPETAGMYLLIVQDSAGGLSRHRIVVSE